MPVQTWTPGQKLTAAELTSVTNMLPYYSTAAGSVNPCVAGTLYRCTSSSAQTMTLPTPALGVVIGFLIDTATSGGVTVTHHSAEHILGPYQPTRTGTSVVLAYPDSYLVLSADGTNWHEVCSGGVGPVGLIASATTTTSQGSITAVVDLTSLSATVVVPSGRLIKLTGFCGFSTANGSIGADLYIKEGATTLAYSEITMSNSVQATCFATATVEPAAGSHTYKLAAGPVAGNTIATMSSGVIPALLNVEDLGSI